MDNILSVFTGVLLWAYVVMFSSSSQANIIWALEILLKIKIMTVNMILDFYT